MGASLVAQMVKNPDVQAGFRKGRGIRDQIANIRWIIEKARAFQKNIYLCFIDYAKAFDCVDHNKLFKRWAYQTTRPVSVCRSESSSKNWTWNNRLVPKKEKE